MPGITFNIIKEINKIHEGIRNIFDQEEPKGEYNINLVIESPPNIDKFNKELKRIEDNPQEWIDLFL